MQRRQFFFLGAAFLAACSRNSKPCADCSPGAPVNEAPGIVLQASWGQGPGQLGVSDPAEANPEAPMSLTVDPGTGEVLLLDQVNQRVQVFAGSSLKHTIALPSGNAQDLALLPNGNIVVADRLVQGELIELDREGSVHNRTALAGDGIEFPAELTALFSNEEGIWGELGSRSIWLLDSTGTAPVQREILPGYPQGSRLYKAQGTGKTLSIISAPRHEATGQKQTTLQYQSAVTSITTLRVDAQGKIYIATRHLVDDGKSSSESSWIVVLGADLKEERRFELKPRDGAREIFRDVEIAQTGAIYQLQITADGASVERY